MSESHEKPGTVTLVYRYTRSLSRWIKAGRPTRSEIEIGKIYESHCLKCDDFDDNRSICQHCGCRVNLSKSALLNKIAMATEPCPADKWKAGHPE